MSKDSAEPKRGRHYVDSWLSLSLKTGVVVSLALTMLGLILAIIAGIEEAGPPVSSGQLLQELSELEATAVITLGVIILLLTPILPVLIVMVAFLREKDRLYLGISAVVLCFLAVSFILAVI
ncbi:MAG TPA: DUF1634 domain-containing protein [Dehalococcoidia bacterium]|nr:DUF1634 domain-containing protein [Dehalococcoidia bacterium]